MIHVPERIGIIGGSGMYDINKGVKPQYCSVYKNKFNKINLLNIKNTPSNMLSEQYWVRYRLELQARS